MKKLTACTRTSKSFLLALLLKQAKNKLIETQRPIWIPADDDSLVFPDASLALSEPDGLLAVGGDLSPQRILAAYRQGIFPWYSEEQPILWWSPDPRTVLFPKDLKISKSLRKKLRAEKLRVTFDQAFTEVINQCALPRRDESGTWISPEIIQAYCQLHELGHAHSVETWNGDTLVGGLYGIAINRVFFGESMFSHESDASKIAFTYLVRQLDVWGIELIDCQVYTAHLESLGAQEISRDAFIKLLPALCDMSAETGTWQAQPAFSADDW